MERRDDGGARVECRLPGSAPPTPAQLPSGAAVLPDSDAWLHPTWLTLKFSLTAPVYFSYEIETAPDGRAATVRARADLLGDGATLTFEQQIALGADGGMIRVGDVAVRETPPKTPRT
jgi:hypothetical protein